MGRAEPRGRYAFRTYTGEDGLGSQSIFRMLQDDKGFLWVGTEDGLYRYDGVRFERFDERHGLLSPVVIALELDGSGALWAATLKGVARWDGARFRAFGVAEGIPAEDTRALARGPEGEIWVASRREPHRAAGPDRFTTVPGWTFGACTALFATPDKRVWAAGRSGEGDQARNHLVRFDGQAWTEFPSEPGSPSELVEALAVDGEGRAWARSMNHLWRLAASEAEFKWVRDAIPPATAIGQLTLDNRGQVLVPTSEGLYRFEGSRWRVLGAAQGLPAPWAGYALTDHEGSTWLAASGVHRLLGRSLWENYTVKEGLPGEVAWSIFRDSRERLWVGTNRGLALATDKGWEQVPETSGYVVQSVFEAPDGSLLTTGTPPTLLRLDPLTKKVTPFQTTTEPGNQTIFHSMLDRDQNIWLAMSKGLFRGDLRDPSLRFDRVSLPGGDADEQFFSVVEGPTGRVWGAGSHGLALYEHGAWRRFTRQDGLLADHVGWVLETRGGDVLVAYAVARGVSRFRLENGALRVVEQPPEDPTFPSIYSLTEDSRGRIWIGTGRGVILRMPESGLQDHFTLRDGLVSEDVNNSAFWEDKDGDVWIGTAGGLARFSGALYSGPAQPPRVWLRSIQLGGVQLAGQAVGGGATEVTHRQNALFVSMASSSFSGEGKIRYEVKLSGIDSAFQPTDLHEVRYPNLGPGLYTFQARSAAGSGRFGPNAEFTFRILPAWYQTLWFKAALVVAALGLVMLLVHVRLRTLRARNLALERVVAERTRELAATNGKLTVANANMRLVLDNVDQGLVMVDPKGGIAGERSASFEQWFGAAPEGADFASVMLPDDEEARGSLQVGYEQMCECFLPIELCLDQMPKRLVRGPKHYDLAYKPVERDGRIEATLLMVSDITSRIAAEQGEAIQREQLKAFERVMRDRFGFMEFFAEARALTERIANQDFADRATELRDVHTLKGNAALFDVTSVSEACHHLEQTLIDDDPAVVGNARRHLTETWAQFAERVAFFFEDTDAFDLSRDDWRQLLSVARRLESRELEALLLGLQGDPLLARFERIAEQITALSKRLGKGQPDVVIRADNVRLPRGHYAQFWSSFAHVVRNVVEHGFQTEDERQAAHKPPRNRVELSGEQSRGNVVITIRDDGRGIAWESLKQRAKRVGLPFASRDDLIDALFHPGVSTTETVTQTSGRGVGMTAVRDACRSLGGSIAVQSEPGRGTTFVFTVPYEASTSETASGHFPTARPARRSSRA